MKRIGVLTFHNAINYGAVLQTYSLQKTIKNMGYDCCTIDYRCPCIQKFDGYIKTDSLKLFFKSLFELHKQYKKKRKFNAFIKGHIELSDRYKKKDLYKIEKLYDKFVVGSDQVWNPYITDYDNAYLLSFVNDNSKKNSYAASFGLSKLPLVWHNECAKEIDKFNIVSTRERAGEKLIIDKINKKVTVDLDPVFLQTVNEWKCLFKNMNYSNKYIFVYMPGHKTLSFAKRLSEEKGLQIIQCGWKSIINPKKNVGKIESSLGPDEFLSLLYNAEYVVTGSFHATAFSIIFHKKFYVEIPDSVGSRIKNLLDMFSLNERNMDVASRDDIDWANIDILLNQYRSISMERLKSIIEG